MFSSPATQPSPALTPIRGAVLTATAVVADLGLGTLVEQGRGVPWGGVLTVVGQTFLRLTA